MISKKLFLVFQHFPLFQLLNFSYNILQAFSINHASRHVPLHQPLFQWINRVCNHNDRQTTSMLLYIKFYIHVNTHIYAVFHAAFHYNNIQSIFLTQLMLPKALMIFEIYSQSKVDNISSEVPIEYLKYLKIIFLLIFLEQKYKRTVWLFIIRQTQNNIFDLHFFIVMQIIRNSKPYCLFYIYFTSYVCLCVYVPCLRT